MAKIQTPESIKSYLGFRTQIYIHCYWGCRMAQSFQKIPAFLLTKLETAFSHNLDTTPSLIYIIDWNITCRYNTHILTFSS